MAKKNAQIAAKAAVQPKFLTPHEAAVETNMSIWYIRKKLAKKTWKIAKFGSSIRIDRADFEKWLAANTVVA